ncbi:hypothetical protein RJ55_04929 [Drechmeria coniospora]|nr:hypothetical protein RJ55_04929 [Drechmeria coniospora]
MSASNRFRASTSNLPRPQTNIREPRVTSFRATQPTYNLLTGAESNPRPGSRQSQAAESVRPASRQSHAADSVRPGSRESSKENMAPPDADEYEKYRREIETLKAEIGTLQYRVQTSEQEREIALSQQSNKLEQSRRREQEEVQQRQAAETEKAKAALQVESARREMDELRESAEMEQKALERKARAAQDEASLLQEQLEDLASAKEEAARISDKKTTDLQMQVAACQNSVRELEQTNQAQEEDLQQAQGQLADRDMQMASLEADVLRLKAHSGDAETMEIIRRELSEQVQHIRALESTNRDQSSELKHLRSICKAVEIVEEEKRTLQRRLEMAETLEAELTEARLQRHRLEDERLAWTAYLKNASETGDDEFDSPEAMARALVQGRLTAASYVEQLGTLRAEIIALENTAKTLREEKAQLADQAEAAKASAGAASVDKARMRIDRQRTMALKEVEYLRAQLKVIDNEDHTMQPAQYDDARAARIRDLELLVDDYKAEVQTLHAEMSAAEPGGNVAPMVGTKRLRAQDEDAQEQLGQLNRKNRTLQDELTNLQTEMALLQKDLAASREQLSATKEHSQTRVLSLRSNPTSDHEAIKRSTLEALRKENVDLLANLRSRHPDPTVPVIPTSVLGAMEREIMAAKAETASAKKSAQRLKEVWGSKSQEFKEAIFSTLGWTVTFIPNGKMRVESTFFPSKTDEHENSIVFDGERGTMKVGGGPKSAFARRIGDQIGFWVREKGCIPGFLAALTLEFYEDHTKAVRD